MRLTVHLSLEELDERLREGLDPFVHDVVAWLGRGFVVQECDAVLLRPRAKTQTFVRFRRFAACVQVHGTAHVCLELLES